MGRHDTYSVHAKGQRVIDRHRNRELIADEYFVIKYDKLDMEAGLYTVSVSDSHSTCDCPAAQRPTCRHRDMVAIFIEKGYIDKQNVRYNFDKKIFTIDEPKGE